MSEMGKAIGRDPDGMPMVDGIDPRWLALFPWHFTGVSHSPNLKPGAFYVGYTAQEVEGYRVVDAGPNRFGGYSIAVVAKR